MAAAPQRLNDYGLFRALGTYQIIYEGLTRKYQHEFTPLLQSVDDVSQSIGNFQRSAKGCAQDIRDTKRQGLNELNVKIQHCIDSIPAIQKPICELQSLLETGCNFLQAAPIPTFGIPWLKESLNPQIQDLAKKIEIIQKLSEQILLHHTTLQELMQETSAQIHPSKLLPAIVSDHFAPPSQEKSPQNPAPSNAPASANPNSAQRPNSPSAPMSPFDDVSSMNN
ncbi:MAG: hypothetical protein HY861_04695 [Chlamydiia bacterium]|nr:hypothetical protein [Chlamydiia bacterium]